MLIRVEVVDKKVVDIDLNVEYEKPWFGCEFECDLAILALRLDGLLPKITLFNAILLDDLDMSSRNLN